MIELSDALDQITDADLAWHDRNTPEVKEENGEKVFSVLEDDTLRRLKTLSVRLLGQAQELAAKAVIEVDPEQARQMKIESIRRMSFHTIIQDIFFHCLKDEVGLWHDHLDESTSGIGLRKGWKVVVRKKGNDPLSTLFENLFGE